MDPDYPTPLYINPVDYFKGGEHKTETAYTKPIVYGSTLFVTLSLHATYNNLSRRPIISGLHMYGLTIAGSLLLGKFIYESRRARHAERDAVLRHYIELHPEDFPPIERRKFRDIFRPWLPIR